MEGKKEKKYNKNFLPSDWFKASNYDAAGGKTDTKRRVKYNKYK